MFFGGQMKVNVLDKRAKNNFLKSFSFFGDFSDDAIFVKTGKERVKAYTGCLSEKEIFDFWKVFSIEGIGLYVGRQNEEGSSRLGMEGLYFFGKQIVDQVVVLESSQEEKWFLGQDLEVSGLSVNPGFVAIKSADSGDFIGVGKLDSEKKLIYNYLPKERRRKV
jgi:NOL1/NOP2/fmu family ribosome biogenesis protein